MAHRLRAFADTSLLPNGTILIGAIHYYIDGREVDAATWQAEHDRQTKGIPK